MIDRISIPTAPGIRPSKPVIKDGDRRRREPPPQHKKPKPPPGEDNQNDGTPHIDEYA
ncbi:hypothetical protein QSV34_06335 [Porticoccus sp. W117]|uniref:hypothetical protein n=1 Tax=Porticoccus sp. W117 TaxID=3054777 RepID=UPI0025921303|nr:hypothetical protein [Porticoccus sp. W117]MDM3870971.1 hypothetical protein [Porticoccus sp. W117]